MKIETLKKIGQKIWVRLTTYLILIACILDKNIHEILLAISIVVIFELYLYERKLNAELRNSHKE